MQNQNDESRSRQEAVNCTFVKTVLMITVVLYHCIVFWTGNWFTKNPAYESDILAAVAGWMKSFHIYGFTFVSGYLFYFLKYEKGKYSRFLPFAVNKMKRLLFPFAFVSVVWEIPFAVYFFRYSAADIIEKYVLGTSPNQLWFLLMLFCVFVFFHPLSDFFAKNNIGGTIVVILFYGIGFIHISF